MNIDWVERARENDGILPDDFSKHKELADDYGLACSLWDNTRKDENFNFFSQSVFEGFLRINPYLAKSFWKKELIAREKLEKTVENVPEILEFLPDSVVEERVNKDRKLILYTSDMFKNRHVDVLREALLGDELSDYYKKYLISFGLPTEILNDEKLFSALLDKDGSYADSYKYFGENIRNNANLTSRALEYNPKAIDYVGEDLLKKDDRLKVAYFKKNPRSFFRKDFAPTDTTDEELIEAVLRSCGVESVDLFKGNALDTKTIKNVKFGMERLAEISPNFMRSVTPKFDRSIAFDLVSNPDIVKMPDVFLKALLNYDSDACVRITKIAKNGELSCLMEYANLCFSEIGENSVTAYNAIKNYVYVAGIMKEVQHFGPGSLSVYDRKNLMHIVATENPYQIKTLQGLKEYPIFLKRMCLKQSDAESMVDKIFDVLGYKSKFSGEIKFVELQNSFTEVADKYPVINFLSKVSKENDFESLRKIVENADFNLLLRDADVARKQLISVYENEYRKKFVNLDNLKTEEVIKVDGEDVEIKKLECQPFGMLMHRIFNFDESQSEKAKILMEDPEKWAVLTGATYISTSFISDKSIKGVMRELKNETDLCIEFREITGRELKKEVADFKKQKMKPDIAEGAVFLGFTKIPVGSLLNMAPDDAMTEHGGGHANVKSERSNFYFPDDLAYKTVGLWNEVVISREDPKSGERIIPNCIICFDGKINDESKKWAKTWKLPIVMIDRNKYIELNNRIRKSNMFIFKETLSISALEKVFYSTSAEDMLDFQARKILNIIKTKEDASNEDRLKALDFMEKKFNLFFATDSTRWTFRSGFAARMREEFGKPAYVSDYDKSCRIKREIAVQKQIFSDENEGKNPDEIRRKFYSNEQKQKNKRHRELVAFAVAVADKENR